MTTSLTPARPRLDQGVPQQCGVPAPQGQVLFCGSERLFLSLIYLISLIILNSRWQDLELVLDITWELVKGCVVLQQQEGAHSFSS